MALLPLPDTPFELQLSFYQVIENLEKLAADPASEYSVRARSLLREVEPYPELKHGITDASQIAPHAGLIRRLLVDYFSPSLTKNEIKAVSIPFTHLIFNHTERLRNILTAAGDDFTINIRDFDEHQFYVFSCCIIINEFYGTNLDFGKPLFYDIPTADGIIKHYRILYNADMLEIFPTEKAIPLTQLDIDNLINNYDDLALWKAKFPNESWILKGFAIMTLYDATVENAVSIFKEKFLGLKAVGLQESMESIFRSIYRIPEIRIGFTVYSEKDDEFSTDAFGQQMGSFILEGASGRSARRLLCTKAYHKLIKEKARFTVADSVEYLEEDPDSDLVKNFVARGIRSFILAPVVKNQQLLGILEVVALRPKQLNSINANKLEVVMPFLTDTVERLIADLQTEVQAVIQDKFTSIHANVYWKFQAEAQKLIYNRQLGKDYQLQEIVFTDVYPLYGQVDIKGSSEARNTSVQKDLQQQVSTLLSLLETLEGHDPLLQFQSESKQADDFLIALSSPLKAGTEQVITNYLENSVYPLLKEIKTPELLHLVDQYLIQNSKVDGLFHLHRRKYESTISIINDKMAAIIDRRQPEAQALFPHYFERFKTDGVEHNVYIGASIAPNREFSIKYVQALRLWQLQVLCEMEIAHRHLKPLLPYDLDVTTLVLVFQTTIAIRFRMDEKRFDVDGSYNARFEIIKKRIDKAHIKGISDRITQAGKLTIVYSNDDEEQEYLGYIRSLQSIHLLESDIEQFEVEDLQGVSGLKALRVKIVQT